METPKYRCDTQLRTSSAGTSASSSTAFVVENPIRNRATFADPEATEMGENRPRRPSPRTAGLKPMPDGTRRMPPFGSPKREGRLERTIRNTGGFARSQVDPVQGRTGAHAQRHGRWRDRSPIRLLERMDGAVPPVFVRPPAAHREVCLNGFPEPLAAVHCDRIGGDGRRVPDAAPKGFSDAAKVGEPAYPVPLMYPFERVSR